LTVGAGCVHTCERVDGLCEGNPWQWDVAKFVWFLWRCCALVECSSVSRTASPLLHGAHHTPVSSCPCDELTGRNETLAWRISVHRVTCPATNLLHLLHGEVIKKNMPFFPSQKTHLISITNNSLLMLCRELITRTYLLLEEQPIGQPLKNSPAFYGTRRFNTVFTRALHWSLSWATSIQSTPSLPISLRSIWILSTQLRLGLPSGLLPSGFPTKCFKKTKRIPTNCAN
jgi:hypothetical protein